MRRGGRRRRVEARKDARMTGRSRAGKILGRNLTRATWMTVTEKEESRRQQSSRTMRRAAARVKGRSRARAVEGVKTRTEFVASQKDLRITKPSGMEYGLRNSAG